MTPETETRSTWLRTFNHQWWRNESPTAASTTDIQHLDFHAPTLCLRILHTHGKVPWRSDALEPKVLLLDTWKPRSKMIPQSLRRSVNRSPSEPQKRRSGGPWRVDRQVDGFELRVKPTWGTANPHFLRYTTTPVVLSIGLTPSPLGHWSAFCSTCIAVSPRSNSCGRQVSGLCRY